MELRRAAVWAGILSGVGLTLEAAFFMASGWSAEAFATFEGAVGVLRDGGSALRLAVVFGVFNLAFLAIFFAGLARHLEQRSTTLGAAVLYLGMIGIAIHAIVPLGLYQAVPAFQGMAAGPEAEASWRAFRMVLDVAQGAGGLFMGLAMIATGIAALAYRLLPAALGVVGLVAGGASVLGALALGTPLMSAAGLLAMTGILLSIVFRIWGGLALRGG